MQTSASCTICSMRNFASNRRLIGEGTFRMPLHLVIQVTDERKIMQQKLFGPILPIVPGDDIGEAQILDSLSYMLSAAAQ